MTLSLARSLLAVPLLLVACGDGDTAGSELRGPAGFNLAFDKVEVAEVSNNGTPQSIVIRYKNKEEIPAKIVVNLPVTPKQPKDLVEYGSVDRTMQNQVEFPDVDQGTITFDNYDGVGKESCGQFNVTFVGNGGSLNGSFCGVVIDEGF